MLQNFRRRYLLGSYVVERTPKGWVYCLSGREKEKGAWSRSYSSIASVTLMIARQFWREVEQRDAPHMFDQFLAPLLRGAFSCTKKRLRIWNPEA